MRDSREMAQEYLELAAGFEARAAHALDRKLGEELRKTAEHYRCLAGVVERPRDSG
jgi:hypothetical protein